MQTLDKRDFSREPILIRLIRPLIRLLSGHANNSTMRETPPSSCVVLFCATFGVCMLSQISWSSAMTRWCTFWLGAVLSRAHPVLPGKQRKHKDIKFHSLQARHSLLKIDRSVLQRYQFCKFRRSFSTCRGSRLTLFPLAPRKHKEWLRRRGMLLDKRRMSPPSHTSH